MRKLSIFVAAFVLTLGLAQCKKEQPAAQNETEGVRITLNVGPSTGSGTNGSRVQVNPDAQQQVTFTDGDEILVVSGGKYVGSLTRTDGAFSGTITNPVQGEKLYFYFLGNKTPVFTTDDENNKVGCTVNISDQTTTAGLPVISMGESDVSYPSSDNSYTSRLYNKCSLMKFNVDTPSIAAICITGMNNTVTVNFGNPTDSGFTYDKEGDGVIMMPGKNSNNETWAIVLPQETLPAGAEGTAYTYDGYKGNRPALDEIAANQYITTVADDLDVNTFDINYMPLTFEAKTGGTIIFTNRATNPVTYRIDGGDPVTIIGGGGSGVINVTIGQKVAFYGNNKKYGSSGQNSSSRFEGDADCYIYGNFMSLINSSGFATTSELSESNTFSLMFLNNSHIYNHPSNSFVLPAESLANYCYQRMFYNCPNLTTAPDLPATNLTLNCYDNMFYKCTNLTTAPALPATTLADYCYQRMFKGCTSLTTAPATLPAESLAKYCYNEMFDGCTSLTTAPVLPATTLANYCYQKMFNDCRNLSSVTCLATNIGAQGCTSNWLNGVASSGTFTAANESVYWSEGVSGIPGGWTRVNAN